MTGRIGGSSFVNNQITNQQRTQLQRQAETRSAGTQISQSGPTQTNEGVRVRITPDNYRQVLGDQADVLLSPQDMKQLFDKGHLDVQRQFQTMESNEGFLTLSAKLAAAIIGPSRSIGAITIDPLFLEMLKDPKAEMGFGYTRINNETLRVLPSPDDPPPEQRTETPPPVFEPGVKPHDFHKPPPTAQVIKPEDAKLKDYLVNLSEKQKMTEQTRQASVKPMPEQTPTEQPTPQNNFALTATESWRESEANRHTGENPGDIHRNTTLGAGFHAMIGGNPSGKTVFYAITSAYLDNGEFAPGVENGTHNGQSMANTIATMNSGTLGHIFKTRADGEHNQYNEDYGFMTLDNMAQFKVVGNPDLTADYKALTGQDPPADATAADVFMLKTAQTKIGTGPDTAQLRERYNQLAQAQGLPTKQGDEFNNVSLTDFYALQYNASAGPKGYPHVAVPPTSDADKKTVAQFRVVAETNFGRRVGESLTFGNQRINNFIKSENPNATQDQLLTQDDAADVNISTEDLTNRLTELGVSSNSQNQMVDTQSGKTVRLVPNAMRQNIKQIYNQLPPEQQAQFQQTMNDLDKSPSVVKTDDMQALFNAAKSNGISVNQGLEDRVATPRSYASIREGAASGEMAELLGMVDSSNQTELRQAGDGQFVVTGQTDTTQAPDTTTITQANQAAIDVVNGNIQSLGGGKGTTNWQEAQTQIENQIKTLENRGVDPQVITKMRSDLSAAVETAKQPGDQVPVKGDGYDSSYERVNDSTWSGAHIEATLQDRELAESFQRITRFEVDLGSAISRNKKGEDTSVLRNRLQGYLNHAGITDVNVDDLISGKASVGTALNKVSREMSHGQFPDHNAVVKVRQHAQDFRAIGYVSQANAKGAAEHIGAMSNNQTNAILHRQLDGVDTNKDGVSHFFDTSNILSSRKLDQAGFDTFANQVTIPDGKSAKDMSLLDVYKAQTANTKLPPEALNEYVSRYNETFHLSGDQALTADKLSQGGYQPTLQDMYALRTKAFDNNAKISAGENGRVNLPSGDSGLINQINNVRLVLETNSPGLEAHHFDGPAVDAVNARVDVNFANTTIDLQDNANNSILTSMDSILAKAPQDQVDSTQPDTNAKLEHLEMPTEDMSQLLQASGFSADQAKSLMTATQDGKSKLNMTALKEALPALRHEQTIHRLKLVQGEDLDKTDTDKYNTAHSDDPLNEVGYGFQNTGTASSSSLETTIQHNLAALSTISQSPSVHPDTVSGFKTALTDQIGQLRSSLIAQGKSPAEADAAIKPYQDQMNQLLDPQGPLETKATQYGEYLRAQEIVGASAGHGLPSVSSMQSTIQENLDALGSLENSAKHNAAINPQTLTDFKAKLTEQIGALKQADPQNPKIAEYESRLNQYMDPNGPLQTQATKYDEYMRAKTIANNGEGGQGFTAQSLDQFQTYIRGAIKDGKIDETEHQHMKDFVHNSIMSMQQDLKSRGLDVGNDSTFASMFALDKDQLMSHGMSEHEADQTLDSLDRLKTAHASLNLVQDSAASASLYQRVRDLDKKLDEFHDIGIDKTAFRDRMKQMASDPATFQTFLQSAFDLPDPKSSPEVAKDYDTLAKMAKAGTLPFPPNIAFVDRSELNGGNGAFVSGPGQDPTIMIAKDLMNDPQGMKDVFSEEMFHYLDQSAIMQDLHAHKASQELQKLSPQGTVPKNETEFRTALDSIQGDDNKAKFEHAWNDFKSATAKYDTKGDEGRAGLYAMRRILSGDNKPEDIKAAAEQGRGQRAQVTSDQHISVQDNMDYGIVGEGGIRQGNETLAKAGSTIEFSSGDVNAPNPNSDDTSGIDYTHQAGVDMDVARRDPYQSQRRPMQDPPQRPNPEAVRQQNWEDAYGVNPTQVPEAPQLTDEDKPGTMENIGKALVQGMPDGIAALGDGLMKFAETIKAAVEKYFADVSKNLANASTLMNQAMDVIYGTGGDYGHDADAAVGRPDGYEQGRTNLSHISNRDYSMTPNYGGVQRGVGSQTHRYEGQNPELRKVQERGDLGLSR